MKKLLGILLAAVLLVSALSVVVFADDVVAYVAVNKGKDANDGLHPSTPKKEVGEADTNGVFSLVKDGGTVVVVEKIFFRENYTWNANGPVTITANYGGKSYINPEPADNPAAGVLKVGHNRVLSVASDLTLDNIILVSENIWDTITVKSGATLTVTDTVTSLRRSAKHFHIIVEKGGKAIINGGTFASVTGEGEYVVGGNAVVESYNRYGALNDTVVYINYAKGSNEVNSGLTPESPKQSFGNKTTGALSLLQEGGTAVFTGNNTIESKYTWNVAGSTVFTAKHDDKIYMNTLTKTGLLRLNKGIVLTVGSDLTLKDIIFASAGEAYNSIVVTGGATLTIENSVFTIAEQGKYLKIFVSEGCAAVINGGTYASISGAGSIKIGPNVNIIGTSEDDVEVVKYETRDCYVDGANGNNDANGKTADKAVKDFKGVASTLTVGGTAVLSGDCAVVADKDNAYSMPAFYMPLTITSVYGKENYKDKANFYINSGVDFIISSDVTFDNVVLLAKEGGATIRVTNNATLTVTDTVDFKSEKADGSHYNIIVEKGANVILSKNAKDTFKVDGEGNTFDYVDGVAEILGGALGAKKVVELTIGSPVAYINSVAQTLDAAPINRNSRTMLPVRFLANTFGIDNDGIVWNDATKTATLKNATTTIVITIGASAMTVNGESVALDSPAVIESSRTYLPVRAIANALGVTNDNISWNDATKTATLIK